MHEWVDRILTPESPEMRVQVGPLENADTMRSNGTQSILAAPCRRVSMASQTLIPNEQRETGARCSCKKQEPEPTASSAALLQRILEAPGAFARQWNRPSTVSG